MDKNKEYYKGGAFSNPGVVRLGNGVEVTVGNNVLVEREVQIGYTNIQRPRKEYTQKVVIGDNCIIRSGAVIYAGVTLGDNVMINHNVILRENTKIGNNTTIGAFTYCEGNTKIGSGCSIYTHAYLTINMIIGDNVFIAPFFNTMSDPRMGYKRPLIQDHKGERGPIIGNNVRISSNVSIQPGLFVGNEAVIGTGSLVTKNVPPACVVFGSPAKVQKQVPPEHYMPNFKQSLSFNIEMEDDTWVQEYIDWAAAR